MQVREVRDFSKIGDAMPIPNLIHVQLAAYQRFLQKDTDPLKRKNEGIETLLREVFPIESYDGNLKLEYVSYDLSEPRYTTDECRALRLTYGMPFRIQVKLNRKDKDEVMEDSIYLGEVPIMIGGGEFIINGAERVIVNQLHRSPGVDFLVELAVNAEAADAAESIAIFVEELFLEERLGLVQRRRIAGAQAGVDLHQGGFVAFCGVFG